MKAIALFCFLSLLVGACGSSDGGSSVCAEAMTKLCDKACGCTADDTCSITTDGSDLLTFDTRADCLGLYKDLGCSQASQAPAGFFEDCSTALDSAACTTQAPDALVIPQECEAD